MSAGAEYWVVNELLESDLSHAEFRILMFLAKKSRDDYYNVWWSERRIAEALNCSKGTVSKAVHKFVELNLLHVRKGDVPNKKHKKHNIYYLHVPYEYRRRGHKATHGASEDYVDFDAVTGEFDKLLYDERIQMEFEDADNEYMRQLNESIA